MKHFLNLITLLLFSVILHAQVGINNTDPKASLDITASNPASPSNTDGLLIPRIDDFPASNPTAAQQGMMVYLTTTSGGNPPGIYYWNNSGGSWASAIGGTVLKVDDLSDGKSDSDGSNNGSSIFLGLNAGANDDSSNNQNVGIGFEALKLNTSGLANTANGYQSLAANTTGTHNTANGYQSLLLNTGGWGNTATGTSSLYSNTTGYYNTAIGLNSLYSNTTGYNNTANGYYSLYLNTTGLANTANGYYSLYSNTIGTSNNALGWRTLYSNTEGTGNSAFGTNSLDSNTTGNYNTALGNSSGGNNSTGSKNVFIGYQSGLGELGSNTLYIENSNANSSTALIYGEFDTNILRTNSEFQIGNPSVSGYAFPATDGSLNQLLVTDGNGQISFETRAIGAEKLDDLIDGKSDNDGSNNYSSVFLGMSAGQNDDSTDNRNVGVGYFALQVNTTGLYNAAFGYNSLDSNSNGNYNTAIGNLSLNTLTTGSNNTALGTLSGSTNLTGTGNIFIGYQSGLNELGSNTLYIENSNANSSNALIYGEFDNDILRVNGELQIGDASGISYAFPSADGTASQVMETDGSGNISWVSPSTGTDDQNIIGSGLSGTSLTIGIENGTSQVIDLSSLQDGVGTDNQNITSATLTGSSLAISIENGTGATVDLSPLQDADWYETGGTPPNSISDDIYTNGNVGIGVVLPSYKLDVRETADSDYISQILNLSTNTNADALKIKINAAVPNTSNNFIGFFNGSDVIRGKITGTAVGVNYATTSDRRLKTKIFNIDNALNIIQKIQARKYEYKANLGTIEYGFIAQELQLIYPQAVIGSPDSNVETDPMMVDYSRLTPLLTAGIIELNEKVIKLEKENQQLKTLLSNYKKLEERLSLLEERPLQTNDIATDN